MRRAVGQLGLRFEQVTRRLVGAEHLRLIDAPAGGACPAAVPSAGAVTVPVPVDPRSRPLLLEAVSARSRPFDAWAVQVLHAAGQVAALILEIEQARQRPRVSSQPVDARSGPPAGQSDGAAPLIGSTATMRTLRHRIAKVAATDFIVLVEGGSGPEAHRDLGVPV